MPSKTTPRTLSIAGEPENRQPGSPESRRVEVRLSPELACRLGIAALLRDTSPSAIVAEALASVLDFPLPQLPSGRSYGPAVEAMREDLRRRLG